MYTLSQIRNRVDALRHKHTLELSVARLHPLAEEFSLEWTRTVGDRRELPQTHPFILRIARLGFRFNTFMNLHRYLEDCRSSGDIHYCYGIIGALYPQLTDEHLRQLLEGRHPVTEPKPAPCLDGPRKRPMVALLVPWWLRKIKPYDWMIGWLFFYPFKYLSKNSTVLGQAIAAPSSLCRSPVQSMKAWPAPG